VGREEMRAIFQHLDPCPQVKSDIRTVKDKPRQLFWEKRLSGLAAYSPDQVKERTYVQDTVPSGGHESKEKNIALLLRR
jgi:hypothetical protein